jgi:hypothetical protein
MERSRPFLQRMIIDRIGRRWIRLLISSREVEAHASLHSKREGVFP